MENIKRFFLNKNYGFYISVALILINAITLILMVAFDFINTQTGLTLYIILPISLIAVILLLVFNQTEYIVWPIILSTFLQLLIFGSNNYMIFQEFLYGADASADLPKAMAVAITLLIAVIAGVVNVFLSQEKNVKNEKGDGDND